jgi:hypothetical protein
MSCGRLLFAACLLVLFAGCSSGATRFKVKGKVVDGDKAVLPDENSSIHLTFMKPEEIEGKDNDRFATMLNPTDGTFEIESEGGIPAGQYRVLFRSMSLKPSPTTQFINRFQSKDTSPVLVDVIDEKTPLVIDISVYKKK